MRSSRTCRRRLRRSSDGASGPPCRWRREARRAWKSASVVLAGHTSKTDPIETRRAGDRAQAKQAAGLGRPEMPGCLAIGDAPPSEGAAGGPDRGRWEGSSRRRGNGVDHGGSRGRERPGRHPVRGALQVVPRTRSKRGRGPRPTGAAHASCGAAEAHARLHPARVAVALAADRKGGGSRVAVLRLPAGSRGFRRTQVSRSRHHATRLVCGGVRLGWWTLQRRDARRRRARITDEMSTTRHRTNQFACRRARSLPPGERLEVEDQARGVTPCVL